jgi:hypothetical protein
MITDELRAGGIYRPASNRRYFTEEELTAIADRIDAEHERMMGEWDYWESTHIKLPVDADGVPIRVGDKVVDWDTPRLVVAVSEDSICLAGYESDSYYRMGIAKNYRHHHAPTVEDVLREFAQAMNENLGMYTGEAIDADEWHDADAKTIAEYAAKLRLAGDAE